MSSSDLVSELSTTAGLSGLTGLTGLDISYLLAAMVPIKIYSNADTPSGYKVQILKENKQKSGIYSWKNLINEKQYIGSAIDLSKRLEKYYSTAYMEDVLNRSNSHIYRALLKNGYSNFSLTILEYCEPEQCLEREKYYIYLGAEYNIVKDPTIPPMSGRTHSEETKQILSEKLKGENHPNFGQTHSDDTKKKNIGSSKRR